VTDAQQREELDTLRKEARAALDIGCGGSSALWEARTTRSKLGSISVLPLLASEQLSTLALQLREQAATRMLRLPPNS